MLLLNQAAFELYRCSTLSPNEVLTQASENTTGIALLNYQSSTDSEQPLLKAGRVKMGDIISQSDFEYIFLAALI